MSLKKSKVSARPVASKRVAPARGRAAKASSTTASKASRAATTAGAAAGRKTPKAAATSKSAPGHTRSKSAARPAASKERAARPKTLPRTVKAKASAVAKPVPSVRFSDADLQEFRSLLTKLRNDLVGKVTYLRDSSLRREDEVNHTEDGTDAFDRLFSLERAGGVQQRIYAIDEALREIDEGTYGICQSCDSLIRKQRLLALPFARNCIDCQSAQERKRNGQAPAAAPRRFVP